MKRFSSVLLASVLLVGCGSVIGGPKHSLEELRSYYGNTFSLLASATKNGNIEHVKSLLKHGVSEKEMAHSFFEAIKTGKKDIVRILLDKNNDLIYWYDKAYDYSDEDYSLNMALRYGEIEIADILIEKGAKIEDHLDNDDISSFLGRRDIHTVKWLLSSGVDVNTRDNRDYTALYFAIEEDNLEVVQELIRAGADVNVKYDYGYTALSTASYKGNLEIVQELIKAGADVNTKDNDGRTSLHKAIDRGKWEIAQELIRAGVDVNAKDNGRTALHLATGSSYKGNLEIVQELIRAGVDINAKDDDRTALYFAIGQDNLEVVQELIRAGADVNVKYDYGRTALYHAIWGNELEIVQELIRAGADVNAKDNNGETLLRKAYIYSNEEIVQELIRAGADVNPKDDPENWKNEMTELLKSNSI